MSRIRRIAFVIGSIVFCLQFVHLAYVKMWKPYESVLDDYQEIRIAEAGDLEELVAQYEQARLAINEHERQMDADMPMRETQKSVQLYRTKNALENIIRIREQQIRAYEQSWFYWAAGVALFLAGAALVMMVRSWISLSIHYAGLILMLWWSGAGPVAAVSLFEYEPLINVKLILSFINLFLLLIAWFWSEQVHEENEADF